MATNTVTLKNKFQFDEAFFLKVLAFIFPFLTVITAFAVNQLYPIGDRTMLTVDLYHQYAPFLYEFRQKILDGSSLFYSWNCGLGNEYFAAFANYTSSPLNIFVLLFKPKTIPVFIALITAVRAGLASLFMTLFLSDNDNRRYDYITVVFGCSYALSGWFLTDFWNIMWCDALVFLPLVTLGLNKLFKEGKYSLYSLMLALTIIANYYTGFFTCLFLVMWAPVTHFVVGKKGVKEFFKDAGKFALGSLVGGMISSVIVLPTYLILQHSSATGSEFPVDFNLTGNLFDFLGRLMVSANPNIRDGMANVFCGTLVVLLLPLFFMAPVSAGISKAKKIGYGIILIVLYLSFTNRMLNFIWHGFHFPNQIPYRESFLMTFVLILIAFNVIRRLRKFPSGYIGASIGGYIVYLILFEKFGGGEEGYVQIGLTLLFVIIQGAVLMAIYKNSRKSSYFYEMLITVTVFVELLTASIVTISTVGEHEGFTGYDFYAKNRDIIKTYAEEVEGTEGHLPFERTEIYPNNICCIQSVYDVKGMSTFSSTARESLVKYMRNFGFHNNGINGLRNSGLTKPTATLLGIRNLVTIENTHTVPDIFTLENQNGEVLMYGNPDALAVGYMVCDDILTYEPIYEFNDVFAKTNDWVRSMGVAADVYSPINVYFGTSENMVRTNTDANGCNYTITDSNQASSFTVTVNEATLGSDVYIYVNSSKGGTVRVQNGLEDYSYEIRSYQIISLGRYLGEPITATVTYNSSPSGTLRFYSYELNQQGYNQLLNQLGDEQLDVTSYTDTSVEGTVTAQKDGVLLMTIPYSESFVITVDGQPAELLAVQDALCAVKLTAGTHNIKLQYVPRGFEIGLAMAIIAFVVLAAIEILPHISRKKKLTEVPVSELQISEEADKSEE